MSRFYYDLHLHSCLSPCGDDEMTPLNIAAMASLKGLNLLALTDHNSCRNCPAFFDACEAFGIVPVPGMELTTAEDIHLVCLFPSLEAALAFGQEVHSVLAAVKNRPEIFGNQFVMNSDDAVADTEPFLLINATSWDVSDAIAAVDRFGGAVYPAHIDREANGMISVLGCVPSEYGFSCVEFRDAASKGSVLSAHPNLVGSRMLVSSDAHRLEDIAEAEHFLEWEDGPMSSALVRERLIRTLRE